MPSLPESRPAAHSTRSHRTPGLQTPPPRRLLSSLPHGPHGMLGKRSFHHHSRGEPERRSGALVYSETAVWRCEPLMSPSPFALAENPGPASGALLVRDPAPRASALRSHVPTPSVLFQYNGRSSSGGGGGGGGGARGGVMIRKRRPNWIDAPDDSFFLVTRETR